MDITGLGEDFPLPLSATPSGSILVLTGKRGCGKTSTCLMLLKEYQRAGIQVGGLWSPGRFENGQKNGIFAVDLLSKETRLAASCVRGELEGFLLGRWRFDPQIFEWGNQCLQRAAGSEVLLIDELGFLEFHLNMGWTAGFDVLRSQDYHQAIVVIRPECLDSFAKMGFDFQVKEVSCAWPGSDGNWNSI